MKKDLLYVDGVAICVITLNTIIVGSGAAGLNAADRLFSFGQKDIAIVTEDMNMGTSRNTGSDKQTYYKMMSAGSVGDSVEQMAKNLFAGGSMDGDIALVEASSSTHCFFHLVDIGVRFPHNRYGEYVGYKTDNDLLQRATSLGPLTSKIMTQKLEDQIKQKGINIFDGFQVIGILTKNKKQAIGIICLNLNDLKNINNRYVVFNCTNIIFATGGPGCLYQNSVYPAGQTGSTGIAFEAGVKGKNLTEWQYGITSTKFRWCLSGSYHQVLPRYISTDVNGDDEREFLFDYFPSEKKLLNALFLKGYQWPFDVCKIENYGSSLLDILVYNETVIKGRRVFLDYSKNPGCKEKLNFSLLASESYEYLKHSGVLFGAPIDRLAHMNPSAIELFKSNGIDIKNEYLEIAVCAQHNNGGLKTDIWWQTNLLNFLAVGEVAGIHGN